MKSLHCYVIEQKKLIIFVLGNFFNEEKNNFFRKNVKTIIDNEIKLVIIRFVNERNV